MKFERLSDTLLHVILPLLAGYFIYYLGDQDLVPPVIKNYFPDGLWAYSLISAVLIIWGRKLNLIWIITSYLLSAGFEWLQHAKWVAGVADGLDVLVYFLFITIGILLNNNFKKNISSRTINYEEQKEKST